VANRVCGASASGSGDNAGGFIARIRVADGIVRNRKSSLVAIASGRVASSTEALGIRASYGCSLANILHRVIGVGFRTLINGTHEFVITVSILNTDRLRRAEVSEDWKTSSLIARVIGTSGIGR
jgi:hypothetical protein